MKVKKVVITEEGKKVLKNFSGLRDKSGKFKKEYEVTRAMDTYFGEFIWVDGCERGLEAALFKPLTSEQSCEN